MSNPLGSPEAIMRIAESLNLITEKSIARIDIRCSRNTAWPARSFQSMLVMLIDAGIPVQTYINTCGGGSERCMYVSLPLPTKAAAPTPEPSSSKHQACDSCNANRIKIIQKAISLNLGVSCLSNQNLVIEKLWTTPSQVEGFNKMLAYLPCNYSVHDEGESCQIRLLAHILHDVNIPDEIATCIEAKQSEAEPIIQTPSELESIQTPCMTEAEKPFESEELTIEQIIEKAVTYDLIPVDNLSGTQMSFFASVGNEKLPDFIKYLKLHGVKYQDKQNDKGSITYVKHSPIEFESTDGHINSILLTLAAKLGLTATMNHVNMTIEIHFPIRHSKGASELLTTYLTAHKVQFVWHQSAKIIVDLASFDWQTKPLAVAYKGIGINLCIEIWFSQESKIYNDAIFREMPKPARFSLSYNNWHLSIKGCGPLSFAH